MSLGDTIGSGTPESIGAMLDAALGAAPADKLAGHYHDTGNRAIANIEVSLEKGLRTFDSSIGGLGGCPYAPGAKGNVSTGAVVRLLHAGGYRTGIDEAKLPDIEQFVATLVAMPAKDARPPLTGSAGGAAARGRYPAVSKSFASWRSRSSQGLSDERLTRRPRCTAGRSPMSRAQRFRFR